MPRLFDSSKPDALTALCDYATRCGILDAKTERELIALAQNGDEAAMSRLVGSNIGFIIKLAQRASHEVSLEDLVQDCCIACVEAVRNFDLSRTTRFSTFLELSLRRPIQLAKQKAHVMRSMSHHLRRLAHDLLRVENELWQQLQREPELEELAAALDVKTDRLRELEQARKPCVFIDEPAGPEDDRLSVERLRCDRIQPDTTIEIAFSIAQSRKLLLRAMDEALTDKQRLIVVRRYLAEVPEPASAIAKSLGVSRQRIGQIEKDALERLLIWLKNHGLAGEMRLCLEMFDEHANLPGVESVVGVNAVYMPH